MRNLDHRTLLTCMQVWASPCLLSTGFMLFAIPQVCNSFRNIITTTTSLQYIIELALAGQVDNPQCNLSAAARIDILRKHQSASRTLDWSRKYSISLGSGGLWELYGGVFGMSTTDGALAFHQLPSDLRSVEQKMWTIGPDFGIREMRDFTMDPAQDLLVLFETPDWYEPSSFVFAANLKDNKVRCRPPSRLSSLSAITHNRECPSPCRE